MIGSIGGGRPLYSNAGITKNLWGNIANKLKTGQTLTAGERKLYNSAPTETLQKYGVPTSGSKDPATGGERYLMRDPTRPQDPKYMSAFEQKVVGKNQYGEDIYEPGAIKEQFQWGDIEDKAWSGDYGSSWSDVSAQTLGTAADPEGKGVAEMYKRAMGEDGYEDKLLGRQRLEELDAREQAQAAMQGQLAGARSQLAMRGGLGSGARERLARGGMQDVAAQQQQIARQGQMARLGIGAQAQQRKDQLLEAYNRGQISLDQLKAQNARFDIEAQNKMALANQQGKVQAQQFTAQQNSAWDLGQQARRDKLEAGKRMWELGLQEQENQRRERKYGQDMAGWGAEQTAQGIQNSGGGGGGGTGLFSQLGSMLS